MFRRKLTAVMRGALCLLVLVPTLSARTSKNHKCRYSEIDLPVSLAVGTVRTSEFPVIHEAYFIMIQAEKRLPFVDMRCMMGLEDGTLDFKDCKKEPLIQAHWTVVVTGSRCCLGWCLLGEAV